MQLMFVDAANVLSLVGSPECAADALRQLYGQDAWVPPWGAAEQVVNASMPCAQTVAAEDTVAAVASMLTVLACAVLD